MNPDINEPNGTDQTSNAISIFGQAGGANDFPVLKAFQEYIDAEQAKARKRMLGLSIFFIVLLVLVVVTFTVVITSVINRNQALSDRLLDIALREKSQPQPVVTVQSPAPQPVVQPVVQPAMQQQSQVDALKPVLEKFDKLAEAMVKAQQQHIPVTAPTPVVVTTSSAPVATVPNAELVRQKEENERLREENRRMKEERKKEAERREAEKKEAEKRAYAEKNWARVDARNKARNEVLTPTETALPAPPPVRTAPVPAAPPAPKALPAPVVAQSSKTPANTSNPATVKPAAKPAARPATPTRQNATEEELRNMKPRRYLDETKEDPELKELLKRLPPKQPAANTAPQPAVQAQRPPDKPKAKAPSKPLVKPEAPPAARPTPKPVVKEAPPPRQNTETLSIGGSTDGNSIPWLIEIPQN